MNYYAQELLDNSQEPLEKPFIYLFSDADGNDLKRTVVEEGKMMTIADILKIDFKVL